MLVEQDVRLRQQALDIAEENEAKRKRPELIRMNYSSASTRGLLAALHEWRLGDENPSKYLQWCVNDARFTLPFFDLERQKPNTIYLSAALLPLWDAMYAQRLLTGTVDDAFRNAWPIPKEQRLQPDNERVPYVHVFEDLLQDLLDTGETPEHWEAFIDWLLARRGTRQYVNTLRAYLSLVQAAQNDDRAAVEAALKEAEKAWNRRTNRTVTWGSDKVLREQMVDFRSACVVKRAQEISDAAKDIDSVHRWRW